MEGSGNVFVITPQTWKDLDKTWNIREGALAHLHKKFERIEKSPQWFHLSVPKGVFGDQSNVALSCINSPFLKLDVKQCSQVYHTHEKFLSFCIGNLPDPKNGKMGSFQEGACDQYATQTAQSLATWITLGLWVKCRIAECRMQQVKCRMKDVEQW